MHIVILLCTGQYVYLCYNCILSDVDMMGFYLDILNI
jgi:hypothetical protein